MSDNDAPDDLPGSDPYTGRLWLGEGLPPEATVPERVLHARQLRAWIERRAARIAAGEKRLSDRATIEGADINGDLFLWFETGLPIALDFRHCRFRSRLLLGGDFAQSVSISDSAIHGRLEATEAAFEGGLSIFRCQVPELRLFKCKGDVSLLENTVQKSAVTACDVRVLRMLATRGEELVIKNTAVQHLDLTNHAVRRTFIDDLRCTEAVLVGGAGAVEYIALRRIAAQGSVALLPRPGTEGARYRIVGGRIAGDLEISAGISPSRSGARIEIVSVEIGRDVRMHDIDIVRLDLVDTSVGRDAVVQNCRLETLGCSDTRVERDFDISTTRIKEHASFDSTSVLRRLTLHRLLQTRGLKRLPSGGRGSNHLFWVRRCSLGGISARRSCIGFKAMFDQVTVHGTSEFTDCLIHDVSFDGGDCGAVAMYDCRVGAFAFDRSRAKVLTFTAEGHTRGKNARRRWRVADNHLSLTGSHVGRLAFNSYRHRADPTGLLPRSIDMVGCTYDALPTIPRTDNARAKRAFYKRLVGSSYPSNPQPYFQLARHLRASGHIADANDIQFQERQRARSQARSDRRWRDWLGLSALRVTIGYGIGARYFYCLFWIALFTVCGAVVLSVSPVPTTDDPVKAWLWRLGASFEQVVPLIKTSPQYAALFEERSGANPLSFWQNAYFAFHRFAGWLLGTFVIAGLAGLTQKPS